MKRLETAVATLLLSGCMAPPPPPSLPPPPLPAPVPAAASYRATGTEPFWGLVIDEREITFTAPDTQPISQPRPQVIVGFAGEIYNTPRIHVNIVHGQCSDGMSDRTYPDKVQVDVDGRRFNGCGGL
ncbi:putative membrane protein [Sphingomonas sp. F9_3S_D5_B_2]